MDSSSSSTPSADGHSSDPAPAEPAVDAPTHNSDGGDRNGAETPQERSTDALLSAFFFTAAGHQSDKQDAPEQGEAHAPAPEPLPTTTSDADGEEEEEEEEEREEEETKKEGEDDTAMADDEESHKDGEDGSTHAEGSADTDAESGRPLGKTEAEFVALLRSRVVAPQDIPYTLDKFPYFLERDMRRTLVSALHVFLARPEHAPRIAGLCEVGRSVLINGPPGTESYQHALALALCRHFGAAVLTVSTATVADAIAHVQPGVVAQKPDGDPYTESSIRSAMRELADSSSGSSSSNAKERLMGAETKSSFKRGDSVRYRPPKGSGAGEGRPKPGARGTVAVVIEEAPTRVGVAFDDAFEGGTDLGGECADGRGLFVDAAELEGDSECKYVGAEKAFLAALSRIALDTATPLVLLLDAADKLFADSPMNALMLCQLADTLNARLAALQPSPPPQPTQPAATQGTGDEDARKEQRRSRPKRRQQRPRPPQRNPPLAIVGTSTVSKDALKCGKNEKPLVDAMHQLLIRSTRASAPGVAMFLRLMELMGEPGTPELAPTVELTAGQLSLFFDAAVPVQPPTDASALTAWRSQMERDMADRYTEDNVAALRACLQKNHAAMDAEEAAKMRALKALSRQVLAPKEVERVVGLAISDSMQSTSSPSASATAEEEKEEGDAVQVSAENVARGLELFLSGEPDLRRKSLMSAVADNEFEKRLLEEVVTPEDVGVSFDDIGALDDVKDTLRELVMLPLQRPELFRRGNLTRPTKGIMLFGPPGTGKTMLARAVATESGANFLNVAMSTVYSKHHSESERYVRAVFTLASKIAPCVVFVDEVDSMLGKRGNNEHETMLKVKNEFMTCWDGLRTKAAERVTVLVATNRPMDLDDAVLRRLNRRILVDLPDAANREKILRVILKDEELARGFSCADLAAKTEGFSGSDLKNLCVVAAHQPIRELLRREKEHHQHHQSPVSPVSPVSPASPAGAAATTTESEGEGDEGGRVRLRALTMADFDAALKEVCKSVHEDAYSQNELRQWNEMFGDSGSRTKQSLTYYM